MSLLNAKKQVKTNKKFAKIKQKIDNWFSNLFGFEANVDLSNDVEVLHRRNIVIKNIIFVTNLLYTIILFFISFNDSKNLILSLLLLPFSFLLNSTLKKMIFKEQLDMSNQKIAMYFACLYMFLSSLLMYVKLKNQFTSNVDGETQIVIYGEVGYSMLYVSLLVVSLYQDKKALATICKWLIVGVLILNFTVTYNFSDEYGHATEGALVLLKEIVSSEQFRDIIFRMFVLVLFMIVLYINVSISQYLLEERKKELAKRKEVENDFIDTVSNLFKIEFESFYVSEEDIYESELVANMAQKLSSYLGYSPQKCEEIAVYSKSYLNNNIDISKIKTTENKDLQFERLRNETSEGAIVIKREASKKRYEELVRKYIQGSVSEEYSEKMKKIYQSEEDQIIGICEVFISLRALRNYKRPKTKEESINILTKDFRQYFDSIIFERFMNFIDKFDDMYVNYGGDSNGEKNI